MDWISISQAAARWGVDPRVVQRYCASGILPFLYWSSTLAYDLTDCAWVVDMEFRRVFFDLKTIPHPVWPVRASQ